MDDARVFALLAPDWAPLASYLKASDVTARLAAHAIDTSKASLFAAAAKRLEDEGVALSVRVAAFWVPGRVEVLGKHTDYAGGRSVLGAVNRGFAVVVAERGDALLRLFASFALAGGHASAEVPLVPATSEPPPSGWATYPTVAARRLARNFELRRGFDLALECDLPEASGMSTSSAVVCLTFLALGSCNGLAAHAEFRRLLPTAEDLCCYLGCLENGQDYGPSLPGDAGVGTFGGSEDHTAIMMCEPHALRLYGFCPTRLERSLAFPAELRFVIAVSGATARKGEERLADYNNAALLARWAAHAATAAAGQHRSGTSGTSGMNSAAPPRLADVVRTTASSLDLRPDDPAVRDAVLDLIRPSDNGSQYGIHGPQPKPGEAFAAGALATRFEQYYEEVELIIPAFADALAAGDWVTLGALTARSHALTCSHLKNTVDETEWLPAAAVKLGALAASAFGAGFGGSCWAIIEARKATALCASWESAYLEAFPERRGVASFFAMSPGSGACSL